MLLDDEWKLDEAKAVQIHENDGERSGEKNKSENMAEFDISKTGDMFSDLDISGANDEQEQPGPGDSNDSPATDGTNTKEGGDVDTLNTDREALTHYSGLRRTERKTAENAQDQFPFGIACAATEFLEENGIPTNYTKWYMVRM